MNHVSWLDIIVAIKFLRCCFVARYEIGTVPVFGPAVKSIGCVLVQRGADQETRDLNVKQICDYQQDYENGKLERQLMVFAEGGTNNGTHLLKFKRGAFEGNCAIQPLVQKHTSILFSSAYDTLPLHAHLVLMLSAPFHTVTIYKMPPFIPNEYLYE